LAVEAKTMIRRNSSWPAGVERRPLRNRLSLLLLLAGGLGVAILGASKGGLMGAQRTPDPKAPIIAGAPLHQVLSRDAIPAIDHPQLVRASEASSRAQPDELFLAVEIGEEAHAYSTLLLEAHEVVNDEIAKVPISASW
jgi:hypothetical protein